MNEVELSPYVSRTEVDEAFSVDVEGRDVVAFLGWLEVAVGPVVVDVERTVVQKALEGCSCGVLTVEP